MTEKEIFLAALTQPSAGERALFLDHACGADAVLRGQIEALLAEHAKLGSYLEVPVTAGQQTLNEPPTPERLGAFIGPYKLLQQIGEGGMGAVYMAEQIQPVQRKVALKLIKPGMDSRQVIARFEAERQALAMMDHVNIARVFDGGTTENGRPYFVMELVHGVPITRYCDDNQLTPRERLELFVPVCQAIQHAHQKGIIHRDIKPSNVMVTLYDGKPVPKIIDFGVAKATEQKLTERTLFTQFGTMVGTFEYMAPEQAETSALGVDTRCDIYSLGVLLFELLTGSTPLTAKRMKEAAYTEILRMIKEEEPPKPSTRLSDTGEGLASIAAQRKTEPAKLTRLVRGELDWIVMKTLEKDRNRRYATANDFATDVERYLSDEPVLACPPSAGYRLRKFARRNKGVLTATLIIAITLVGGMVVSARQTSKANARHLEAENARQEAIANLQQAREAVDQMLTRVAEEKLYSTPQTELLRKGLLEDALKIYERLLRQAGSDPAIRLGSGEVHRRTGQIYQQLGQHDQAEQAYREAIALLEKLVADSLTDPANRLALTLSYHGLGSAVSDLGRFAESESALRQAIGTIQGLIADFPEHDGYLRIRSALEADLAWVSERLTRVAGKLKTEEACRENLQLQKKLLAAAPNDPQRRHAVAYAQLELGRSLQSGQPQKAERLFRDAIAENAKLTSEFPHTPQYRTNLAEAYHHLFLLLRTNRRYEEAEGIYHESLPHIDKVVADAPHAPYPRRLLIEHYWDYALMQEDAGRLQDAEKAFGQAILGAEAMCSRFPTYAWAPARLACVYNHVGKKHQSDGRFAEAEAVYRKALDVSEKSARALPHMELRCRLADSCLNLGLLLKTKGREAEAERVFRKLFEPKLVSAEACNDVAWVLATDTARPLRPPDLAVTFARKAVELAPADGVVWTTLGVAQFRAQHWQESIDALQKSQELRKGGASVAWFFLAMAQWELGARDEARRSYDRAVKSMNQHKPDDEEVRRFRAEAEKRIGIDKKRD
jgi:serine/threonine protein kinase